MKRFVLITSLFLFFSLAAHAQETHMIEAGGGTGEAPYFDPQFITIEVGDVVEWNAVSGFHAVDGSQDSFPENPEGFSSGSGEAAPWTFSHTFTMTGEYDFECPIGNHSQTMFGTITVVEGGTSNVDDIEGLRAFKVYPNPAADMITIDKIGDRAIERLEVFNIVGQMVYTDFEMGDRMILDASKWEAGIYVLRATTDTGETLERRIAVK